MTQINFEKQPNFYSIFWLKRLKIKNKNKCAKKNWNRIKFSEWFMNLNLAERDFGEFSNFFTQFDKLAKVSLYTIPATNFVFEQILKNYFCHL